MGCSGSSVHRLGFPLPWCCVLQLDQICISFDEGKTTMNFIEAALLIQGSACVYSKKVGPAGLLVLRFSVERTEVRCPAGAGTGSPASDLPRQCLPSPPTSSPDSSSPLSLKNKLGFKIVDLLLNTRQCTGAPHAAKNCPVQSVSSPTVEKPVVE